MKLLNAEKVHSIYREDIVIRARNTLHTASLYLRKLQPELLQIKSAIKDDVY